MNKILIILLVIVSIINSVCAYELPDTLTNNEYTNRTVDLVYTVNSSDTLTNLVFDYTIKSFPSSIHIIFSDDYNNKYVISNVITKENKLIGVEYKETFEAYKNNQKINFSDKVIKNLITKVYKTHYSVVGGDFHSKFDVKISLNELTCCYGAILDYQQNYNSYIKQITLPVSTDFKVIENVRIKYKDSTISLTEYEIDKAYDSMNFVFKLMFATASALLAGSEFLGLISNTDFLGWQKTIIAPLSIIDTGINALIFTISFFLKMGVLFSLVFTYMVCFIYANIITHSIYDAIPKSFELFISILEKVVVNPLKWIFVNVVKFWKA